MATIAIIDFLEPLFQNVCRVQREASHGRKDPAAAASRRHEFEQLLEVVTSTAEKAQRGDQWSRLKEYVIAFIDIAMASEDVHGSDWKPLSRHDAAGKNAAHVDTFLDGIAAECNSTKSDLETIERLDVYYHCLALGGHVVSSMSDNFESINNNLRNRLASLDRVDGRHICPDPPKPIDRPIVPPDNGMLVPVALIGLLLVLGAVLVPLLMYKSSVQKLEKAIRAVETAAAPSASPPSDQAASVLTEGGR